MAATNPMGLAHETLWTILEYSDTANKSDPAFTTLVLAGNRIKYTSATKRAPRKLQAKSSDYPEVEIQTAGGAVMIGATSDGTQWTCAFRILVRAGDQRMQELWLTLWAVLRALAAWETSTSSKTWNSKAYITDVRPVRHSDQLEKQRNNAGWSAFVDGQIDMWFDTADMIDGIHT